MFEIDRVMRARFLVEKRDRYVLRVFVWIFRLYPTGRAVLYAPDAMDGTTFVVPENLYRRCTDGFVLLSVLRDFSPFSRAKDFNFISVAAFLFLHGRIIRGIRINKLLGYWFFDE